MDTQLIAILALTSAILILALVFLLARRTVIASIAGFSWQRKVELEQYIWVKESSYLGYPAGCRNQHSTFETYYTNTIVGYNTSTIQNPNGTTSTTSTPIYSMMPHTRRKYLYEIQRWRKSRGVVAEGDNRTAYWPHYILDASTHERVCHTKENYLVSFQTAKGKHYRLKLTESEWAALDDQTAYRLRVTLYRRVMRFEPDPIQVTVISTQTKT